MTNRSFYRPDIFDGFPDLVAAETTRLGGVSKAPYGSLNLGKNTDDDPEAIRQNRELLCAQLGIEWRSVAYGSQVHGAEICRVTEGGRYDGFDGFITNQKGVAVAITVADCTPILIYDPMQGAVAAIHAGWRGAAQKIGTKALQAMQAHYGTRASDCYVYIGTCIEQEHFEVGTEVMEVFDSRFCRRGEKEGKYFLDLKAAIKSELIDAGVQNSHLEISTHCTWKSHDLYFSHRREQGKTGRFLALIGIFETR